MLDSSAAALAALWDRAAGLPGAQRQRALLGFGASAERNVDGWTLGRCDATLARTYAHVFGDAIEASMHCTACDASLEFETSISVLFGASDDDGFEPGAFCIRYLGYELTLRPLVLGDLAALPPVPAAACEKLLRACVSDVYRAGARVALADVPLPVRAAIGEALRAVDTRCEILVILACADCRETNRVRFDIASFWWEALESRMSRMFADVHALASAYGWPESTILALSEARRRRYLELVT